MPKHNINIVKGSQLQPFIRYIQERGECAFELLRRCFCPVSADLEEPSSCVPTIRFWQLIEATAQLQKDGNSSWEVAQRYGLQGSRFLGYQLENQPNLRQALSLYTEVIAKHSNSAQLVLQIRGNDLWLLRTNPLQRTTHFPEVEVYFAGLLIHLIRNYLGASWRPAHLAICGTTGGYEQHVLAEHCGTLHMGAKHFGIAVPLGCLDQKPRGVAASIPTPGPAPASLPTEDHRILKCLMHCYLVDYPLNRTAISSVVGLHPKTLARALARNHTSFRIIRSEVLTERAQSELRYGNRSIGDIAQFLRYAHQSAFTRAFQKKVGISPEQFRAGS